MDRQKRPHRIYLIRHGETDWNSQMRYQGSSDIPLNANGVEQAERLGLRMSTVAVDRILTSPLSRARQTAEIIARQCGGGVRLDVRPDLREMSFGIWEGLTVPEIRQIDSETYDRWKTNQFACHPRDGESYERASARAAEVVKYIESLGYEGGDTVLVCHGGIVRLLASLLLRYSDSHVTWRMRFDNCSVSVIDLWSKGPWLLFSNDTHHLRIQDPGDIPKLLSFPV